MKQRTLLPHAPPFLDRRKEGVRAGEAPFHEVGLGAYRGLGRLDAAEVALAFQHRPRAVEVVDACG